MTKPLELDTHVRVYDDAIDWTPGSGTSREAWPVTRDMTKLVIKPGRTVVKFKATRLGRELFAWAMETDSKSERCFRAFRAGVRRVEGLPDGPWAPANLDAREFVMMTNDEQDSFDIADQLEIGGLVLERSVLPKACAGGYSVQPSSRHVWAAMELTHLSAEQSRATSPPTPPAPAKPSEG